MEDKFEDIEDTEEQEHIPWDVRIQTTLNALQPYIQRFREQRKGWIWWNAGGIVVLVAGLFLFAKPYYDASVIILPDYGSKMGSAAAAGALGGLASSISGISLKADPNEIYENILKSESVLAPVIEKKYVTEEYKDSVNLIQYFKIKPDDDLPPPLRERKQLLKTINMFVKGILKTDVDFSTKILTVTVRMPESQLGAEVVNNIVHSLDVYIRTQRRSNASNQRRVLRETNQGSQGFANECRRYSETLQGT